MKSVKVSAVVGVNEGYELKNQKQVDLVAVCEKYKSIAQKIFSQTGQYISCTARPVQVLYSPEWGCPLGGENAVEFVGVCNPTFSEINAWREAAIEVFRCLKEEFNQSTVTVDFTEVEMKYLQ